jgi:hypothetical protein
MTGEPLPELAPGEKRQLTLDDATAAAVEAHYYAILDRLQRETKALLREHWPAVSASPKPSSSAIGSIMRRSCA